MSKPASSMRWSIRRFVPHFRAINEALIHHASPEFCPAITPPRLRSVNKPTKPLHS
jgi:hypothetical protein